MCWRCSSLFLVLRALSRCSVKKCICNRKECNTFSVFQVENCKRVTSYIDIPSPVNAILHSAPTDATTDFKGIFTLEGKSSHKFLHLEYRQHSVGNAVPTSKLEWFKRWLQVFFLFITLYICTKGQKTDLTTTSQEIQFYILRTRWQK